jgi:hypothetical protein
MAGSWMGRNGRLGGCCGGLAASML